MFAHIYQPAQNAMQSGQGDGKWVLEFIGVKKGEQDPLTGTYRSTDMLGQVKLSFDTVEDAIEYAKSKNIPHRVTRREKSRPILRSYGDNFAFDRKHPWTH